MSPEYHPPSEAGLLHRTAVASYRPSVEEPSGEVVLIILDPADPDRTVRNILRDVDLRDCSCHVLLTYPTAEYESRRQARIEAGVNGEYTIEHLSDEARQTAESVGARWTVHDGGEFRAFGHVGRVKDAVRHATARYDYARIYLPRPRTTIWTRMLGLGQDEDTLRWGLPPLVQVIPVDD